MVPSRNAEDTVREFVTRFGDGSFAQATDLLTADGRTAAVESFPDEFQEPMDAEDALELYWLGLYAQYGDFEGVGEVEVDVDETGTNVTLEFEDGTEWASIDIDDGTGITGFSFSSTYEIPGYVDRSAFSERNVTVDTGDVNLEGVIAIPDGTGPFPAVLLVHGAGIHDLDGTDGASKILKDLAWGLASQGIATLRYEKRLAKHEVEDENYTLDTVVVNDAVAAVDELVTTDKVAEDAVFVAGHSQGGMCAPRIAARHGDVTGIVALDARADSTLDPDHLAILRYEFEPDGNLSEDQEAELERERETVRRLSEGDYADDETIWGRPGIWHRSVGAYDPAGTASSLDVPCFVLKAGRADEEMQPELAAWFRDEFEKWRTVDLADGSRVEFYEGLDHFLQKGFTPANPMGLYFGGNVAECIVSDLVGWIDDIAR
ncbi:alpha/beta fold hydrolase [Natronosalvus caseinilyticus]|uniref:alpha/beta fold hydrolase n=1 Tax=Natronosalvus caseinilyticus TaxID=2953747 RepID=UPI0028AECC6A|nr:alpha/beta fold hydrolase [Natronosalvus caseinilyticus]